MSDIVVSGTIILALPIQSGVSQRGNQWSRASYVIEHESGQYPKRLVFDVKDAKIQELALAPGQQVTIHLNADAHEWPENSGKWFNNLSAWKVDRVGMQQAAPQYQPQPMQGGYQPQPQQQYQQAPQYQPQPAPAPFPPQQPMPQQPVSQPVAQPAPAPFPPQQPAPAPAPQPAPQGQQAPLPFPPAQ